MKTQNKKKNISLRIASGMAVAALLSTCAISSTFAKYTTSTTASDTARVAYWGFKNDSTITFNLFNHDDANIKSYNGTDKVIAPGSKGSASFSFAYTDYTVSSESDTTNKIEAPEVAYEFTVDATATGDYDSLDANNNFKWTLQKGTETAKEYKTAALLITDIKKLSGATDDSGKKTYAAYTLPDLVSASYTIGWVWDFGTDGTNDSTDTAMGNADNLDNVKISITITATQIN